MFNAKPKRRSGEYSIYQVSKPIRFVGTMNYGIVLIICANWMVSWGWEFKTIIPLWIVLSLANQIYYLYTDWMVVSPQGIEFDANGKYGYIEWDNIAKFTASSIHLLFPIMITGNRCRKLLFWSTNSTSTTIESYVIQVPTTLWGKAKMRQFAQTPFGQEVLCYAPHLFDGVKEKRV